MDKHIVNKAEIRRVVCKSVCSTRTEEKATATHEELGRIRGQRPTAPKSSDEGVMARFSEGQPKYAKNSTGMRGSTGRREEVRTCLHLYFPHFFLKMYNDKC